MNFGKQIANMNVRSCNNQQTVTQEVMDTNIENAVQKETENQGEDMNDVTPSSPDFSNFTTDLGDNPYIRRPHSLKVHLFPQSFQRCVQIQHAAHGHRQQKF